MSVMDLSALSAAELERLLKAARGGPHGLLLDRVQWEIAERAAHASRVSYRAGFQVETQDVAAAEAEAPADALAWSDVRPLALSRPGEAPRRAPRGLPWAGVGLVAGVLLTAGVFWGANGAPALRLPTIVERPAAPVKKTPPPAPPALQPAPAPAQPASTSDAVAGVLAPEPFPPPAPPAPAIAPPPPPVEIARSEPAGIATEAPPTEVARTEPAPKAEVAAKKAPEAEVASAKKQPTARKDAEKAVATRKDRASKTQLALRTEAASRKALAAKKAPAPKTRLAARSNGGSKVAVVEKTASTSKPAPAAKAQLAAKTRPAAKAAPAEVDDPIGVLLARVERQR